MCMGWREGWLGASMAYSWSQYQLGQLAQLRLPQELGTEQQVGRLSASSDLTLLVSYPHLWCMIAEHAGQLAP